MGEPSSATLGELRALVKKQFPASSVVMVPDQGYMVLTLHGVGISEEEALKASLKDWQDMQVRGRRVQEMLDEISEDLRTPGMSRERHDELLESLDIASSCLNDGILTGVIGWIEVPGINRRIDDLRRRVDARLGVAAQDAADHEAALAKASEPSRKPGAGDDTLRIAVRNPDWDRLVKSMKECGYAIES